MAVLAQPGLWLIATVFLAGILFIIGIVTIQSRSESADRTNPAEEEWSKFRDSQLSRTNFMRGA